MNMPLENIHVCDMTAYIAGAVTTTQLADLGAKVIKIEGFEGDGFRPNAASFVGWNPGKRSIVVDNTTDEGRQITYQIAARSDLFTENSRPGVTERLKLTYDDIRQVNPNIVYVRILAYGSGGPSSGDPGFDPLIQARSGMMSTQGGYGKPPVFIRVAVNDYMGAMLGTMACSFGLLARARTGQGQLIEASMINAACFAQSGDFIDYEHRPTEALRNRGGQRLKGVNPAWRLYKAQDDWLVVACAYEEHWQALCRVLGLEDLARRLSLREVQQRSAYDYEVCSLIESALAQKGQQAWLAELEAAGVPGAATLAVEDIIRPPHPHALANDILDVNQHTHWGQVVQLGTTAKFWETPGKRGLPAPLLGEHTVEVLQELGYSQSKIDELLERNIVGQQGINVPVK